MIVSCPECGKKYKIPDDRIGDRPKKLKCRSCSHVMVIEPPDRSSIPDVSPIPEDVEGEERRAVRFARVLASDMLVYNREQIEEARRQNRVPEEMASEIQRSWELWQSRYPEEAEREPEVFSNALEDFIGDGQTFADWEPPS